jgi:hypothetical protein
MRRTIGLLVALGLAFPAVAGDRLVLPTKRGERLVLVPEGVEPRPVSVP